MFKVSVFVAGVLSFGLVSAAQAYSFRPGSEPAGGRVGKVCNTQMLSEAEQADCLSKMKGAKNDAERREIRDTIRDTLKERQKQADYENERLNPGGANQHGRN